MTLRIETINKGTMTQYLLAQISAKIDFIQKHNYELQVEVLMARNLKNI